jgi:hypothetical protein
MRQPTPNTPKPRKDPQEPTSSKHKHPAPSLPSNTNPVRRKKVPSKPLKIRVAFSWPSACQTVRLFSPKEQGEKPVVLRPNHRLFPGRYRVLCTSSAKRLHRRFEVTILRTPSQQKISLSLRRFRQRIFIRPWAFLYMDGFFVPACQSACEIEMWSGKTEWVLKQCPAGFSAQRCLQQPASQQIVFRRTLQAESPIHPALTLRWK